MIFLLYIVKGQRNRERPKRSWEKDVEDWMEASVWRVEQTAEYRLMYGRSTKAATSGNGTAKDRQRVPSIVSLFFITDYPTFLINAFLIQ